MHQRTLGGCLDSWVRRLSCADATNARGCYPARQGAKTAARSVSVAYGRYAKETYIWSLARWCASGRCFRALLSWVTILGVSGIYMAHATHPATQTPAQG
jgi:hypothetical protein